jgi:hypothetical protein
MHQQLAGLRVAATERATIANVTAILAELSIVSHEFD